MGRPNRLVALLDSLLNGGGPGSVHFSRFHYDRLVRLGSGWLTGEMLERAGRVPDEALDRPIKISVEGIDCHPTLRTLLLSLVERKEAWGAMFGGLDIPQDGDSSICGLKRRWEKAKTQYGDQVRRIATEGAWETTFIDAECDPPQTFTYGGAIAHVLTFSAYRRTLALGALHDAGITDLGSGDPMRFELSGRPSRP